MAELDLSRLGPWEQLLKRMLWRQLGDIRGQRLLDFGSGEGYTSAHFAPHNDVTALEPSPDMLSRRVTHPAYRQLEGGVECLSAFVDATFDLVLCHNVLEYVDDKAAVLRELTRVLRPGGALSLVKHNRPGRVLQMAVLLDDFDQAHRLLSGEGSPTSQFGEIRYYEDGAAGDWCPELRLESCRGLRAFWDLQQRQEKHGDPAWQAEMLRLEERVAELEPYRSVAFFHHLVWRKE